MLQRQPYWFLKLNMNLVQLIFAFFIATIIFGALLINSFEKKIPSLFSKLFRYGKFAYKGDVSKIQSIFVVDLPKSWFKHFYVVAVLFYSFLLYTATSVYILKQDVPLCFITLLNVLCGNERTISMSVTKVYLGIVLMTLQVFRRVYDTHFVSVFGKNSKINFSHYLIGIIHYPLCGFAIISEAPKFTNETSLTEDKNVFDLTIIDVFAIILFLWAWWHQHVTTKILANLRKNGKGDVVSDKHKLPQGDWFKFLSAPHQTAEILMYFSLTILLWPNITWCYAFAWVLCNQTETMLLSHWWYLETFDKFPKERKALIPFLY